jgi:hypothetical protein
MSDAVLRAAQRQALNNHDPLSWSRYVTELIRHGVDPRAIVNAGNSRIVELLQDAGRRPVSHNNVHYSFEPWSPGHCQQSRCKPGPIMYRSACRCACPRCYLERMSSIVGDGVIWRHSDSQNTVIYGKISLDLRRITEMTYLKDPVEKISIIIGGDPIQDAALMHQEMQLAREITHQIFSTEKIEYQYTTSIGFDSLEDIYPAQCAPRDINLL